MSVPRAGTHGARLLAVLADGLWLANEEHRERILSVAETFPNTDAQTRWLVKVNVTEGCWFWTASTLKRTGYGQILVKRGLTTYAHRWAYLWFIGEIPEGLELDHVCRTPACVNPTHLEAVTHAENVRRGNVRLVFGGRTHCNHGHEFTPENTRMRADGGGRVCITCARATVARYRERNQELTRQRDREAKRRQADALGKPERWPGRVHPMHGGRS